MIKKLALKMKEKNKPELEAFDAGMINYAKYLSKKKGDTRTTLLFQS